MSVPRSDLSTKKVGTNRGTGMKNLVELFCDVDDFCKVLSLNGKSNSLKTAPEYEDENVGCR